MAKTHIVRYETTPETTDDHRKLVEEIFAEFARERPEGLDYAVLRLADGVTFVHVVMVGGDGDPLKESPAHARFRGEIGGHITAAPVREEAEIIGRYSAAAGQPSGE